MIQNKQLYEVRENIIKNYKKTLILMFVDPFGRLDNQIKYNVFLKFTRSLRVDLIMNINALMLALRSGTPARSLNSVITSLNSLMLIFIPKTCYMHIWPRLNLSVIDA